MREREGKGERRDGRRLMGISNCEVSAGYDGKGRREGGCGSRVEWDDVAALDAGCGCFAALHEIDTNFKASKRRTQR